MHMHFCVSRIYIFVKWHFYRAFPRVILYRLLPKDYLRGFLFSRDEWSRGFGNNIFFFYLFFKVHQRFSHGNIVLPWLVWGWILPICPRRRVRYLSHLPALAKRSPFSPCRKPSPAAAAANINPRRNSPRSVPTLCPLPHSFRPRLSHPLARVRVYPPTLSELNARNLWPWYLIFCTLSDKMVDAVA